MKSGSIGLASWISYLALGVTTAVATLGYSLPSFAVDAVLVTTDPESLINVRRSPTVDSLAPRFYGSPGDRVDVQYSTVGEDGYTWYYVRFEFDGSEGPRFGGAGWVRGDLIQFPWDPPPEPIPLENEEAELFASVQAWASNRGADNIASFRYAFTDLNQDQHLDAVVYLDWCGNAGCTMLIFQGVEHGFGFISNSTITLEPIQVLAEVIEGWMTLIVYAKTRGSVVMQFDGTGYPLNPSLQPSATIDQIDVAQTLELIRLTASGSWQN